MRTLPDIQSVQLVLSEAKPRTELIVICKDWISGKVRIVGFDMTSHTNKSLLKVM